MAGKKMTDIELLKKYKRLRTLQKKDIVYYINKEIKNKNIPKHLLQDLYKINRLIKETQKRIKKAKK
jgi:hypothetical protein